MSKINGTIKPIKDRVIVSDMYFGEQTTKGGLVLLNDDGKETGIKPRWGRVYAKGPENHDPYQVGDWVLIEHGRWTRGITIENETDENGMIIRMIDNDCILMWSDEKPEDV